MESLKIHIQGKRPLSTRLMGERFSRAPGPQVLSAIFNTREDIHNSLNENEKYEFLMIENDVVNKTFVRLSNNNNLPTHIIPNFISVPSLKEVYVRVFKFDPVTRIQIPTIMTLKLNYNSENKPFLNYNNIYYILE